MKTGKVMVMWPVPALSKKLREQAAEGAAKMGGVLGERLSVAYDSTADQFLHVFLMTKEED